MPQAETWTVGRLLQWTTGYLKDHGWEQGGPLREIYLVNPAKVASLDELMCEVQVPWIASR